ncbi:MAG TPA: RNA polymerase sigma factor [Fimbriimonadaceae bacterium]|nr:RNA polymerase sigma factor [Fimbriimonadaceae bacterium]
MSQHKDAVYRQIARVCGNYDDAQDVLVQTLLAAYKSIDQVRDPEAMRGWLATIGRRICRRMKQREAVAPILQLVEGEEPAEWPNLEDDLETGRIRDCVKEALSAIPEPYREVYLLRDIEEVSGEETAERLGITLPNMKSRLRRARRMVREALDAGLCDMDLAA